MGKLILLFFFLLFSFQTWAQISIDLGIPAKEVQTDALGNAFVILEDGAIQKYNAQGVLVGHFRESGWGIPSQLDVLNPLNPIVFYSGKGFLQEFDNNLTPIYQLPLEGGFTKATLIARSSDGNFWWYRERDRTLVKINRSGQIVFEGTSLDFLDLPQSPLPVFLFETAEKNTIKVQMYDPQFGLFTFGANAQCLLRRGEVRMDAWYRCGKSWGIWKEGKPIPAETLLNSANQPKICRGIWKISGSRLIKDE